MNIDNIQIYKTSWSETRWSLNLAFPFDTESSCCDNISSAKSDLSEGLLDRKEGLVGKTALAMTRIRTIPTKRGTSEA